MKMTELHLEDVVFLGIVSILTCIQLASFALKVGAARKKHKIQYPAMTGHPDFERCLRAHQNNVEFISMFLTALWTAGIFFHQVPAAIVGMVYIYGRKKYVDGYIRSVEERVPGFRIAGRALQSLTLMATIGIVNVLLKRYLEVDIRKQYLPF